MSKKMIVVDLDGTLLDSNKKCSLYAKEYLNQLKDNGYIITIATGRSLLPAIRVTDGASFANYIISNGGSVIYDMKNQKVIYKQGIKVEIIKNILLNYYNQLESFVICSTNFYYRYHPLQKLSVDDKEIIDIFAFLENNPEIIHCCFHPKDIKTVSKLAVELQTKYPMLEIIPMQDSFSSNRWLDIFSKNISKYHTISILANLCKIENDDIIAFGDGLNDSEMLLKCGVGVAMGNALDEVKASANMITLSNNEDGVIVFLDKFLANTDN